MTPPDEWTPGRLNDLAAQVRLVAALSSQVATHQAKIDGHDDTLGALRDAQREAIFEFRQALKEFDEECDKKVVRLEKANQELARETTAANRDLGQKIDAQAAAHRWTPAQWAAIMGPWGAALLAALGLVLTKGSP